MIGRTISHYKILEKLGEGGMGVVYKAEDTKLQRTVALKFLPSELTRSAELKRRFLREAQAAAILDHPNICTIYETNEMEGQTFIAMAYIDGYTLQETVEMGPLNLDDALVIAIQVAEGLQEAHEKGIIHRDVKLSNIMITGKGQARITDFGLAKLLGQTTVTETGKIMGTVDYMSPEQAGGEAVDHRTDIWSLGVVLYEMLTGRKPFDAESKAAVIHKIIYEEPDRLTDNLPSSVEAVVEKMMQKEPRYRYENTAELLADLRAVRAAASITGKKESPSIAVLPFANMSADPEQEYFCDGLAEELINALTHVKDLKVIARTSAFSFKGKSINVRDIGKELRVRTVLEGSVRKAGNRLRITAQLVDTAEGHHLWSERYDRELEDVFAIQDEITLAIVDNLKPVLLAREKEKLVKRHAVDPEVYDLYLRGRYFWNKATAGDLEKAIKYFQKAVEKDPNYALAYAGMADYYSTLPFNPPFVTPKEVYPKARAAALKAVQIDDTLAEAHTSLAVTKMFCEWKWEDAEKGFRQAIAISPGYATAHYYYPVHLMFMRRFQEAIEEIHRARELDPLSPRVNREFGQLLYYTGYYDRAIETFQRTLEIAPNMPHAHLFIGGAYLGKGMFKEALGEFAAENRVTGVGNPANATWTALTYVRMGNKAEAQKILDEMLERSKKRYVSPFFLASLHVVLGETDRGFQYLDKAYEECDYFLGWLGISPAYDSVRSDPRYTAMLKKIGLAD